MLVGGLLEFFLGNTFPAVVFMTFGGFWFSLASTLVPSFGAYAAYSPDSTDPAAGSTAPGFQASFAFFYLFMGMVSSFLFVTLVVSSIEEETMANEAIFSYASST